MKYSPLAFPLALSMVLVFSSITAAQNKPQQITSSFRFGGPINYPKAIWTLAYAINDKGQVVGYYTDNGACANSCGFTKVGSQFTSVNCAEGIGSAAYGVSNKGVVVGGYVSIDTDEGFILQSAGSCFILDPFNSDISAASGVNDDGDIVGYYSPNDSGSLQGFLYAKGNYTKIACEGWANTYALGVNDSGVIVGIVENADGSISNAFIYKTAKCSVFGFHNHPTAAVGINKKGQISGYYFDLHGTAHGWVKTEKKFITLDYPSAVATLASALNDHGQVAGWYKDSAGAFHGFVATPKKK